MLALVALVLGAADLSLVCPRQFVGACYGHGYSLTFCCALGSSVSEPPTIPRRPETLTMRVSVTETPGGGTRGGAAAGPGAWTRPRDRHVTLA